MDTARTFRRAASRGRARHPIAAALVAALLASSLVVAAPSAPATAASTSGTDFWVAFLRNISTPTALDLFITGQQSTTGQVEGAPLGAPIEFTVTAGQVTTVSIPITARPTAATTGAILDLGIRITAGAPVTVYGINQAPATTDGFLAIPVEALGKRYRIATVTGGSFGVVATQDDTVVSVDGTEVGTLDAGQMYYSEPGGDPSGTLITANHPVSVFAGHPCSSLPGGACDHLVEQLPPTDAWGSDFIAVRYANETNQTNLFLVVADQDDTIVSVDGVELVTLAAGGAHQFRRFGRDGNAMITGGRITATKPIVLIQFMQSGAYRVSEDATTTGDPAMSVIPPFEQFQTSYTLATMASGFVYNAINVVIPTAATASFRLNGAPVSEGTFVAIGSTGFSGAQIFISPGTYQLGATQPFGVFLYGGNPADSYAVPGGMSLSPVALISSLVLSSTVTTGTIDGTPSVCFSATVQDSGGAPLAGIRVDFALTGVLTDVGSATTDASGVATACFLNTSVSGGSVDVTASVASLTASGSRTIPAPGDEASSSDGPEPVPPAPAGPGPSPVSDPGGGLPSVGPGGVSGSVGGAVQTPVASVPVSGAAQFSVGPVDATFDLRGAGGVSGPAGSPVLSATRDRVATLTGGGMQPGGIAEVWMPLPDGGSRQIALLPIGPDGRFDGALPFTGELDGRGPLPIGDRTLQLFGIGADGQLTVINVGIRITQPGPLAPEPDRGQGAPPTLTPGQSLATNAGLPTTVTVTPLPGTRSTLIEGDGWRMDIAVPEGSVRDENGSPLIEIVLGDRTVVGGNGFMPGTRAYVWLMSDPTFLGEVTVAADGTFSGSLPVRDITLGQHTLQVSGVGTDGYIRAANLGVIVTGTAGTPVPSRVNTGGGPMPLVPLPLGITLALAAILLTLLAQQRELAWVSATNTRRRTRPTPGRHLPAFDALQARLDEVRRTIR